MGLDVLKLDPAAYRRHAMHAEDRAWVEKNCYFDIWIEVVHALGCEPYAMSPVVVALDWVGDQWTFFKPAHSDLWDLYGLDVQELNCWKPLLDQAKEHLAGGRLISTEADAWWLPDVSGTDYRTQHTKSTIVLTSLDIERQKLGYFHNAGYFELTGEDFVKTFRLDVDPPDPTFMPFFAETVATDRVVKRPDAELREISRGMLAKHLARRPKDNPVARFAERFTRDLGELQQKGLAYYHAYAFATVRQLGASAEVMAMYLAWLDAGRFGAAIEAYTELSGLAKSFILKAARAVNGKKPFAPDFAPWIAAYDRAIANLVESV
ncbi:MAG TPA: DUF1839 family protein [Kofleriaceae bacterium]